MKFEKLISKVAKETDLTKKDVRQAVKGFFEALAQEFRKAKPGENLRIQGYGTFKVVKRKARKARNPQTGEEIRIPPKKVLTFKPSEAFIEELTD